MMEAILRLLPLSPSFAATTLRGWMSCLAVLHLAGPGASGRHYRTGPFLSSLVSVLLRHEALFIQEIVQEIRKKLDKPLLHVTPHLVGRNDIVNDINLWLQDGMNDVCIATIYGIGGVGKTTVASIVYNLNYDKFDGSSFLANVRENSAECSGLIRLQEQLISDFLKKKDIRIRNINEGIMKIKEAVRGRRVLVVLDDLDDFDQFNAIIGMWGWFSPGSKIIITTRCEDLLRTHDVCQKFKVSELGCNESLELLSWHAFGRGHPIKGYAPCSSSIVEHCGGLPLALQVLGASLSGKSIEVWESMLKKFDMVLNDKIQNVLIISFESLTDDLDKQLFLNIACFFIGKDKDHVAATEDHVNAGISNLIGRCLLYVDGLNCLRMHHLLIDMGRTIVHRDSPNDPGKRSRLWRDRDAIDVLRDRSGTESVLGLSLNLHKLEQVRHKETITHEGPTKRSSESFCNGNCSKRQRIGFFARISACNALSINEKVLETSALGNMPRLKLLMLDGVELVGEYGNLPKSVVWLSWTGFPLEFIPVKFCLEKLVVLEMCNSKLKHNWKGGKVLESLKILNLSHCHEIIRPPDFTGLHSLERLILIDCSNLEGIDDSVACLHKLLVFNLEGCKNLQTLSREICTLKYLEEIVLAGCSKLRELPPDLDKLESLKSLDLDGTSICVSESESKGINQIGFLRRYSWTSILPSWFLLKSPRSYNFSMANLPRSLVRLKLTNCNLSDDNLSIGFSHLRSLTHLYLDGNPIHKLPESICSLSKLTSLSLRSCEELHTIPQLPERVCMLDISYCTSIESVPSSPEFMATGCDKLVEIQRLLKLKDITSTDAEFIKNIGLFYLEPAAVSIGAEMLGSFTSRRRKGRLQVLHESGISSIFLPGSVIPSWFIRRGTESCLCIDLHPRAGHQIYGLNICVQLGKNDRSTDCPGIEISNKTKGKSWIYTPSFYGLPTSEQDVLWLSHWRFEERLEAGDHVHISLSPEEGDSCLLVKDVGVCPVYRAEDERKPPAAGDISPWYDIVPDSCDANQGLVGCCPSSCGWYWQVATLCNSSPRKACPA